MWPKFGNSSTSMREVGLSLGMAFKSYTSVAKGLYLKVRKFWGVVLTFVEVTGEKLVGRAFLPALLRSIVNRVKIRDNVI